MAELDTPDELVSPAKKLIEKLKQEEQSSPGEAICCGGCLHPVTKESLKIEVMERHEHFLVNPHGYRFLVLCFSDALGCVSQGDLIAADSWFPGFYWRFALCAECQQQLGWHYLSDNGDAFYGLIADRIVYKTRE